MLDTVLTVTWETWKEMCIFKTLKMVKSQGCGILISWILKKKKRMERLQWIHDEWLTLETTIIMYAEEEGWKKKTLNQSMGINAVKSQSMALSWVWAFWRKFLASAVQEREVAPYFDLLKYNHLPCFVGQEKNERKQTGMLWTARRKPIG